MVLKELQKCFSKSRLVTSRTLSDTFPIDHDAGDTEESPKYFGCLEQTKYFGRLEQTDPTPF